MACGISVPWTEIELDSQQWKLWVLTTELPGDSPFKTRPRGIGWRGRWEGGSGWGIHVIPWLIDINVWQNPLQYCKIISLQLIKINEKINKINKRFKFLKKKNYYHQHLPSGLLKIKWWVVEVCVSVELERFGAINSTFEP